MKSKKIIASIIAAALSLSFFPAGGFATTTAEVSYAKAANTGTDKLSKKGYTLKWQDNFDGDELNRDDWNVELHEAGWVNSEQQAYVDSPENIEVKDGKLIIKPVDKGDGKFTSGRVNTQGKHDFKYGLFEAKVKVPKGQGYLPAFWMMPTDENLYGQWPRCGEIDIMEVMGQDTSKAYGTIHYGNPHKEDQNTKVITKGKDYSDGYHKFAVEWVPGRITWYIDGVKFHETRDWYTANTGDDAKTFPAPFDQPFYMILNLAVGGSWVGNVDDATVADMANQQFVIDYVKAYQLDSYDESNVTAKSASAGVTLRNPDKNGNYINNGTFSKNEKLADGKNWEFMTALGGDATAKIADKSITIKTKDEGTVDYSVQLVQANLPMKKNSSYQLSFEAKASEARDMKVAIQGPDQGWIAYMPQQTASLGTDFTTYTYDFTVTQSTDPNGRLDFNMGALGSKSDIVIKNVVLKETASNVVSAKTVRSDGNYIYNGAFDQGKNRLGNWEILKKDKKRITVTNDNGSRKLKVVAPKGTTRAKPVIIEQSELGLTSAGKYALSYKASAKASGNKTPSIEVAFANVSLPLTKIGETEDTYTSEFDLPTNIKQKKANLTIAFCAPGTYYLDDIRLEDNALLKNGSFNAGLSGWNVYVNSPASASYVIDSISEDNAMDISISDTGGDDDANNWYIQLNQDGIKLEKGKKYRLTFKAKSDLARNIQFTLGHNGETDNNWDSYSDYQKATLGAEYQTYSVEFVMNHSTDNKSRFNITLGSVGGKRITTKHRVCIDDVELTEL